MPQIAPPKILATDVREGGNERGKDVRERDIIDDLTLGLRERISSAREGL